MIAVMPKYNPFAEKAGMQKVTVKEPSPQAVNATAILEQLGFDRRFFASQRYVQSKLSTLTKKQLSALRTAFLNNSHPMYKEVFGAVRHKKQDKVNDYRKGIKKASPEQLARLVKVTGVLLQTKVYLFWSRI
jgi:hypothetical protein